MNVQRHAENALMAYPKVMEAAVIAVPDARSSEQPAGRVMLAPGVDDVSEAELMEHLATHFAKFQNTRPDCHPARNP